MKSLISHTKSLAFLGAVFVGITTFNGAAVVAQDATADAPEKKESRRLPGISEKIFKDLAEVTELVNPEDEEKKPDFKAAYKKLAKLEKKCAECNNYEKSQIFNMFAYVAYTLEKYDDAVGYYKKVVEQSPEIPIGVELQSMMYIAQLSFQLEKYDQAVKYLDLNMKLATETGNTVAPEMWQFKGIVCYQGGKKQCAFDSMNTAVDMVEAKGNIADETWYNLQRSMYLEREDYRVATEILEKMLRHYPKKAYWGQIGSMYGLLERSSDQLQAMDAAYLMGAITKEKELLNLSYLFMADEVPYRAAKIMQKGMDDKIIPRNEKYLDFLATALQASKEYKKAIPVLNEVGKMSKSGNFYADLASVHLDLNDPKQAIKSGKLALKKGNFTRGKDGELYINLGIAYFDTRQYEKSIESFKEAKKIKKIAKFASGWLRYAENENKRYNSLKKALADSGVNIEEVLN